MSKKDTPLNAQEYLEKKRQERGASYVQYHRMVESVKDGFSQLGVSSVRIGSNVIEFNERIQTLARSRDENYFTEQLNLGNPLFILNHNTDGVGYYGNDKVLFADRELVELIDIEEVMRLAPTCTIYAPLDQKPWENIFSTSSYQIFVTDKKELDDLYKNLLSWVKTQWHDDVTKTQRHAHKAENVFQIMLIQDIPKDIGWKYAQLVQAQKQHETLDNLGQWNSASQNSFKNILRELVSIEEHPTMSEEIKELITKVEPLLEQSMDGKKILVESKKKVHKAENALYKGWKRCNLRWSEWTGNYQTDSKQ